MWVPRHESWGRTPKDGRSKETVPILHIPTRVHQPFELRRRFLTRKILRENSKSEGDGT